MRTETKPGVIIATTFLLIWTPLLYGFLIWMIIDSQEMVDKHGWYTFHAMNLIVCLLVAGVFVEFLPRTSSLSINVPEKFITIKRFGFFRERISFEEVKKVNLYKEVTETGMRQTLIIHFKKTGRKYIYNSDVRNFRQLSEVILSSFRRDKNLTRNEVSAYLKFWLIPSIIFSATFFISTLL